MTRIAAAFFALTLALLIDSAYPSDSASSNRPTADDYVGNWALVMPSGDAGWLTLAKTSAPVQGGSVQDGSENDSIESHAQDDSFDGQIWTVGHPKAIEGVRFDGQQLRFTWKCRVGDPEFVGGPPTGPRIECPHTATVVGDRMKLVRHFPAGSGAEGSVAFSGKRMPAIPPRPDLNAIQFGPPIELFNGHNLDGWRLTNPQQLNGWKAVDGELVNTTPKLSFDPFSKYGNLRTDREFMDFRLTIDFKVPPGGNSGIYLRGVYEAQVLDRDSRMQGIQGVGAIFGRIAPTQNAGKLGDQWQHYDITLVDRHATVILNGIKVIDNQPIAGCTNGALQADETVPGPLYLQGDHTAVAYRNLVLRPVLSRE